MELIEWSYQRAFASLSKAGQTAIRPSGRLVRHHEMTRTRTEVVAAIHAAFPKRAWPRVLMLLDTYGASSYEPEVARVQLAILKLSEGSEAKLREYVAVAKRDYRDALFWAEHPDEAKLDTPEKRQQLRELFEKLGMEPPTNLFE